MAHVVFFDVYFIDFLNGFYDAFRKEIPNNQLFNVLRRAEYGGITLSVNENLEGLFFSYKIFSFLELPGFNVNFNNFNFDKFGNPLSIFSVLKAHS